MIVRGGTSFRVAVRRLVARNWLAVLMVIALELGAVWLHDLVPSLRSTVFSTSAVGVLAAVVGVFVAFRFNEAYSRWWEARILWGGMVNVSRSFARQVTTLLTPERVESLRSSEQASAVQRELVYRHLAFIQALRLSLRRQDVLGGVREYVSPEEASELGAAINVPAQIMQRQGERLGAILGPNVSERVVATHIDSSLSEITDLQGGMERIKNTAFPDRVIVATRVLVWTAAALVAVTFIEPEQRLDWLEFTAILVIVLSFLLVKQLGEELNDPFENRDNDTPMTALCRTIEIDLRQQLGETDVPAPLAPVDGVLM